MLEQIVKYYNQIVAFIPIICGVIVLLLSGIAGFKKFLKMSKEEKLSYTIKMIKSVILKMMADAEVYYSEINKSGAFKKSQVIYELYEKFPYLSEYKDQDTIIELLNSLIEENMIDINKIEKPEDSNDEDEGDLMTGVSGFRQDDSDECDGN